MLPLPDRIYVELYRAKRETEIDHYIRDEYNGDTSFLLASKNKKMKRRPLFSSGCCKK